MRLPAYSLTEVLVSLSLASLIFVVGSMIFLRLNGYQNPDLRFQQRMEARNLLNEIEFTEKPEETTIAIRGVQYARSVKFLNKEKTLCEVRVTCSDPSGNELFSRSRIVFLPEGRKQ